MTMITTNPLANNVDYTTNRYPILAAFESPITYVYQDGAKGVGVGGYATIGIGFLVSANVDAILKGIDPNLQTDLGLSDTGYSNLVTAIQNATLLVRV